MKKDKWVDPDFGPRNAQDIVGHKMSLYKDGNPPQKGYKEPDEVEWMQYDEMSKKNNANGKPGFIDGGAASTDCIQGDLGDCWLISAMSVLVTRDELLVGGLGGMDVNKDMIVDKEMAAKCSTGVWPPIFHRYRSKGIYVIRIFKNFQWVYVIIDERIPVDKKTSKPIFGHCIEYDEMWVALIEKAYAKLHGCYGNLISGYIDEGIQELTGFQPEKILLRNDKTGIFPHKMIE